MKVLKHHLLLLGAVTTILTLCIVFIGSSDAGKKGKDDVSLYKWGYWDKMVPPAAGPRVIPSIENASSDYRPLPPEPPQPPPLTPPAITPGSPDIPSPPPISGSAPPIEGPPEF